MYIPWSSAHPEAVKRSFVKAELTRYMILSSKKSYFEESKRMFFMNLRRRGYPPDKLSEYERQERYEDRVSTLQNSGIKRQERDKPLLFPSIYNEVWRYINLNEVFDKMRSIWLRDGVQVPDSLKGPLVKSLRRTENLFDKVNVWNVELLSSGGNKKRSYEEAFGKLESQGRIEALRSRPNP